MRAKSWQWLILGILSCSLPACGGTGPWIRNPHGDGHGDVPPPASAFAPVSQNAGQFASIPRVPGEVIPIHPVVHEVPKPPERETVVAAAPKTETEPAKEPSETEVLPPLVKAFQAFYEGKSEAALRYLEGFDPSNQELLLQLIPSVVQVSRAPLSKSEATDEAQALAGQFEAVANLLAKRMNLSIRKAAICLSVDGFGVYLPVLDKNALLRSAQYLLYVEIGNVPCEPKTRSDGVEGFETRLNCEMQVKDETGRVLEIVDFKTGDVSAKSKSSKVEFTRSPVRDYHVTAKFNTPSRSGLYTVGFEIRDPRTGQTVSKPISFRVQ